MYKNVIEVFTDTFQILKTEKEYFGVPDRVENKIDDAVFFSSDSTNCMIIVLQKSNSGLVFGNARMIRGHKQGADWKFQVSLHFSFSRDYFDLYKDNTFQNISILARYSVLTDGNVTSINGCEIDEHFWFKELDN